jgi:tight adherence protein C
MRYAMASFAALAVYLVGSLPRQIPIKDRVGEYLLVGTRPGAKGRFESATEWLLGEHTVNRLVAGAVGALTGVLLAQGDLFVQGPGRSVVTLALLGGVTGWLLYGMHRSTMDQRRARRLRFELPVVADTLALHIIAGESVASALDHYVEESSGVAADELAGVLSEHHEGLGLSDALHRASQTTSDREGQRLYTLLAHAHDTGGRLADSLGDLSADYRAALSRDLTAEGGRRALATYGPVLALMVPVTLLFLVYPTLAGLRSLAGSP